MRRLRLLHGLLLVPAAWLLLAGGCTTNPINTSLRALEQSGRASFVCLGSPLDGKVGLALDACRGSIAETNNDYTISDGGAGGATGGGGTAGGGGATGGGGTAGSSGTGSTIPHLYALVTQTFRGEVAVIDLTTTGNDALIDQDPTVPGPNFLPMGAQPTGIVSTPGGTATFVTVAEVGREGIFAIPSSEIVRRKPDEEVSSMSPPHLSDWPACSLPAAPGEPMLINDPLDDQHQERVTCESEYAPLTTGARFGDLTSEGHGRVKIAVPLPSLGGIGIFDAQKILNLHDERPDGDPSKPYPFPPCEFDRWVELDTDVPLLSPPQPEPPPGVACVQPKVEMPKPESATAVPAGMALAGGMLFVADLGLPLIHRLDVKSPCEPREVAPLLPFAAEEPSRVVTTSRVAVTPQPTAGLKRYLYADDVGEGTVMVFDVSDGSPTLTPLERPHPEWTPTAPRDRLRFVSAPRDLIVAQRDVALDTAGTGVATEGIFCDPNPRDCSQFAPDGTPASFWDGTVCTPGAPGTVYQTASDYSSGAAPYKLRGTFGFVLLTNGQLEIIDIEDLDAPCRGPGTPDALLGCQMPTCTKSSPTCADGFICPAFEAAESETAVHPCLVPSCKYSLAFGDTCPSTLACPIPAVEQAIGYQGEHKTYACSQATSLEDSCNVVMPNTLRSSTYMLNNEKVGNNSPGIAQLPLVFDKKGALQDPTTDATVPQLRATLPIGGGFPTVSVAGSIVQTDEHGAPVDGKGHMLALNLETPRAQSANQTWSVTFEGPLPRLGIVAAELRVEDKSNPSPQSPEGIYDSSAAYCDGGVLSRGAAAEQLLAEGVAKEKILPKATDLADRLEITASIPEQDNSYWKVAETDETNSCSYATCNSFFGAADAESVKATRDFVILEAYDDHLELEDTEAVFTDEDGQLRSALEAARCCFPTFLNYVVRPGDQWTVIGSASGFLHHVVPDPVSGACRPSCDPTKSRLNGRARRTSNDALSSAVKDGDPTAFINQALRFAVVDGKGTQPGYVLADKTKDEDRPLRDTQFRVSTSGAFVPLTITLLSDTRDIAPVGITFIQPTGELAVTDGALQGLLTISLSAVATNRQYY